MPQENVAKWLPDHIWVRRFHI